MKNIKKTPITVAICGVILLVLLVVASFIDTPSTQYNDLINQIQQNN